MKNYVSVFPRAVMDSFVKSPSEGKGEVLLHDTVTPWAVISICGNHEDSPILLHEPQMALFTSMGCVGGVTSIFVDITEPHYLENKEWYDSHDTWFTETKAKEIIAFVDEIKSKAERFVVHCDAGKSRSGAVGLWLTRYLGWSEKAFTELNRRRLLGPNSSVLHTLMEVSGMRKDYFDFWENGFKGTSYREKYESKDMEGG